MNPLQYISVSCTHLKPGCEAFTLECWGNNKRINDVDISKKDKSVTG